MSMSVSCGQCGLSYAGGRGLAGIWAQPRRLVDRRFWAMLLQVPRFHRRARRLLAGDAEAMRQLEERAKDLAPALAEKLARLQKDN